MHLQTNHTGRIIIIASVVLAALFTAFIVVNKPEEPIKPVILTPDGEIEQKLGNHVLTVMEIVKSPLSPSQRQLTAQLLVRIALNTFERTEDRENWVYVLGIESRFDQSARSPVGAVGVGQIMPQYAQNFGKLCGLPDIKASDAEDILVNATLSACLFRHLLETVHKRSVVLALAAYNAGPNSSSTKNLQNYGSAVPETANYVAKFSYLKEMTNVEKKGKGKK